MKLVMIHGRAQGGRNAEEIREQWIPGLQAGFAAAGVSLDPLPTIELPYYGDTLDRLTAESVRYRPEEVVTRGAAPAGEVDELTAAMIKQMAIRAGIDPDAVFEEEELTVTERGVTNWGWVQALARRLEGKYPWLARGVIGSITSDVKAYIDFPHIQDAVHEIIAPALNDGPCVVVSHSLGTVVAYWILQERFPNLEVPLLLTAGSPLGLETIKDRLPSPLAIPPGVARWLNVTDEEDIVALHASLDGTTFVDGIENLTDIENHDEPHAIERYLADPRVGRAIHDALR